MVSLKNLVPRKSWCDRYVHQSLIGKILLSVFAGGVGTIFLFAGILYFYIISVHPNALDITKFVVMSGMIALLMMSLLLVYLLRSQVIQPLQLLINATEQGQTAIALNRQDEIGQLALSRAKLSKKEFLANLSHDLRTPLNGILGYAQILQRTEPLSPRGRKGVYIIQQCGTHLLRQIDELLDVAKLDARKESKFHLSALLSQPETWANTSSKIIGYQGVRRKILVVDDRWENRSVLINLLEPLGFELLEANNGQEGLERAIATQPDVLLTDLNMPVMDGFQLIQHLRSRPEFQATIIMTSSTSVSEIEQSAIAGAHEFLPKPIQADHLLDRLHHHLKLNWIYEKIPKISDSFLAKQDTIKIPSSEIVEQLRQLVIMGDLETAIEAVSDLQQRDPNLTIFAQTVIELAEGCELKALSTFLDQAPSQSSITVP